MKPIKLLFICLLIGTSFAEFNQKNLALNAEKQKGITTGYNGKYVVLPYPNGDVPIETGVCSDVVIRAYRSLGIDLQQRVHEDMKNNFYIYPNLWGLQKPDASIDHRRVPNLQLFFTRFGKSLPLSQKADNFQVGDIVTWDIKTWWRVLIKKRNDIPHIGIVSIHKSKDGKRPLVIHNIGHGVQIDDMLFDYKITGHYRYNPDVKSE